MTTTALSRRLGAEALGTFWLVLGGCGAAVLAGDRIGFAGIAAAFGLTVLTAAYALGHISGGHFHPAVTVGLTVAGRFAWKDVPGYGPFAGAICEVVLTAMFVAVILGVTAKGAPAGFGPAAIGLALTLIHLVNIPVTNASVNPARSFGVAVWAGSGPQLQLWLFVVAPLVGAAVAGVLYRAVSVGPLHQDAGAEAR